MNPCWEILIPHDEFNKFTTLMEEYGFGGFTASTMGDAYWIFCYPSDDVKIMAKLRFKVIEMPRFGVEIEFTDHPSSQNSVD